MTRNVTVDVLIVLTLPMWGPPLFAWLLIEAWREGPYDELNSFFER